MTMPNELINHIIMFIPRNDVSIITNINCQFCKWKYPYLFKIKYHKVAFELNKFNRMR